MIKLSIKILIILLIISFVTSCRWITSIGTPYFHMTNFKVPDGTAQFQEGFKHGCSTVLYARGNMFYRSRYKYYFDPKMTGNTEYRFGHARGYSWCFQQVLTGPVASFDKYLFPGGYNKTFSAQDINTAWDGMFKGGTLNDGPGMSDKGLDGVIGVWTHGIDNNSTVFGSHPLWAGGAEGQFLGLSKPQY